MVLDLEYVRGQFPSLTQRVNGQEAAFLDAPGGTQVPQRVIRAMADYLAQDNANKGGAFMTSRKTDLVIKEARQAMADFLGSDADEVAFGENATTLIYRLALALGRGIREGDEILITQLDHEANRGPWQSLIERGAVIREVKIDPEDCSIDLDDFKDKLSPRTRIAAFIMASNVVGSISPVKEMVRLTRSVDAISVVDAVHYALHGPLDVHELGVDFLVTSVYKFFGPHLGVFYGRREVFESIDFYSIRPQRDQIPYPMESGTLNHEGLAGAREAVEFIADLGAKFGQDTGTEDPQRINAGMKAIEAYEEPLFHHLWEEMAALSGVRLYGPAADGQRTPTLSFTVEGYHPRQVAEILGEKGIFVWNGHFYANRLVECLGLLEDGGLVRVGLAPYNSAQEIERLILAIRGLVK